MGGARLHRFSGAAGRTPQKPNKSPKLLEPTKPKVAAVFDPERQCKSSKALGKKTSRRLNWQKAATANPLRSPDMSCPKLLEILLRHLRRRSLNYG